MSVAEPLAVAAPEAAVAERLAVTAPEMSVAEPLAVAAPEASVTEQGAALRWDWLGRAPYARVLADQVALRERVLAGESRGALLLCEHAPTLTLGRSADRRNVLASPEALRAAGVAVHEIERGGDVTYHGPGQLMIYPVVRVRSALGLLACVGEVLAALCADLGVVGAEFRASPAGLWLGEAKLAACGLHLRRGVVIHGWALNVATPPQAWTLLRPCGGDAPQRSLAEALAARGLPAPEVLDVAATLGQRLARALPAILSAA
ncbi:MAG: lipoyl(octanoyl) transferase LipB [Kofleriaceae bacterium]